MFAWAVYLSIASIGVFLYRAYAEVEYQSPLFLPIAKELVGGSLKGLKQYRFSVPRTLGFNSDFPQISIDIKTKHYRELEYAASHDLEVLDKSSQLIESIRRETEVPATIRLDNQALRAKVRLKGDRPIHWASPEHWSFRVKLRGEETLFGMKQFSLQRPVTRNYVYEWLFHEVLKREGLIALRYRFVNVSVNGNPQGVYALEEHFDKRLIEHNRRREGPILRYSEEEYSGIYDDLWADMLVAPYSSKRWNASDPQMLNRAAGLLVGFRQGTLPLSAIFDVPQLARYFAVCDFLSMFHGSLPKSIRFYFNPLTQKLEPIGYDGHFLNRRRNVLIGELGTWSGKQGIWGYGSWFRALFNRDISVSLDFWEAYVRTLERLSEPVYLETLLREIDPELQRNLDFLYADFPFVDFMASWKAKEGFFFYFSEDVLRERQKTIRKKLSIPNAIYTNVLPGVGNERTLRIANRQRFPVEALEVYSKGKFYQPRERTLLNGVDVQSALSWREVALVEMPQSKYRKSDSPRDDYILYRLPGAAGLQQSPIQFWLSSPETPDQRQSVEPSRQLADWALWRWNHEKKMVQVRRGKWKIDQTAVLPRGYSLHVGPGTTLDFTDNARMVVNGGITFRGIHDDPIKLVSSDGTGQGLLVIGNGSDSMMSQVHMEGLTLSASDNRGLTSVLTFYESNIEIRNVTLRNNKSEDSINLVRSSFTIEGMVIDGATSDAFDSDFSNGVIAHSRITNSQNDALDFSGSRVRLNKIRISGVGDKAISVGEASNIVVNDAKIGHAEIAVAIKDGSNFEASRIHIESSKVGIILFRKKPEFGPATAVISDVTLNRVDELYWLEPKSELVYNSNNLVANKKGIGEILYPSNSVE